MSVPVGWAASLPLLWQGAQARLCGHGLAEPTPAPLLAVWVLAFPCFSVLELGVGVLASSAPYPLL